MTESVLEPVAAPAALGHRQILIAFSGLVLAMLLAALDSTIVSTALPTIVSELGGLEHLAWVVTGYLLAQTIVTPIYGKLGDLYGRKIVLQSAIVLFLLGSALCGLSQNMTQLILFRAVQGLGGGGLVASHAGPDRDDGPLARIVRIRRAQSQGTRLTTAPVPAADVRHHISGWTDRGLRAVRLGDVLPAFPAGRERSESDGLGAGDDT